MARKLLCRACDTKLYPRDFYPSERLKNHPICKVCAAALKRRAYKPAHKLEDENGNRVWAPDKVIFDAEAGKLVTISKGSRCCYWSKQMIDDLKRYYSTTLNQEMADMLGVSPRTVTRKARELNLVKDATWLAEIHEERRLIAQTVNRRFGNSGMFRTGERRPTMFQKGECTWEQIKKRLSNETM